MKESSYKSYDELPLFLNAATVAKVLGVSAHPRRCGLKYKQWPKRDPIKNYFQLPNEIFLLGLSPGALAVYSYLLCCENRNTYQCWPSYKTIGRAVRMSANTVRKYVCELEERRLISTESTTVTTKAGLKRNGNLLYTIRPIQLALDQFYEQQLAQIDVAAERHRVATTLALRNNSAHST
ncbi:hypothetical protein N510_001356 [Firmicutes bacterium ASF500]|nr:hypothetical protein N510_001356 [Firmicutes bacterium ASF500]